jgi:hypothetical protein
MHWLALGMLGHRQHVVRTFSTGCGVIGTTRRSLQVYNGWMQTKRNKAMLRAELAATRVAFHAVLNSLSNEQLHKTSANPAWTNKQLLFHIALGFFLLPILIPLGRVFGRLPHPFSKVFALLLNAATWPFNGINALGPHIGGRVLTRRALGTTVDWVYARILRQLDAMSAEELQRGMYYPDKWEPLFRAYMTLEDIVRYPTLHFQSHRQHITM